MSMLEKLEVQKLEIERLEKEYEEALHRLRGSTLRKLHYFVRKFPHVKHDIRDGLR